MLRIRNRLICSPNSVGAPVAAGMIPKTFPTPRSQPTHILLPSEYRTILAGRSFDGGDKYDERVTDWGKSRLGDDLDLWRHFNKPISSAPRRSSAKEPMSRNDPRSSLTHSFSRLWVTLKVHVSGGVPGAPLPEFYRLVSSFKFGDDETEVVQACGKYLALTHKLVEFFVARFGESDR